MRLDKTSGNIGERPVPKTSAQYAAQSAKPAAGAVSAGRQVTAQQSAAQQSAARSVSSLISAAGLPADKTSASIISFSRFFSLPLKPELLKHIRQQAFAMTPNATAFNATAFNAAAFDAAPSQPVPDSAPEQGTIFKNREALSLAASAAESKGVELQSKGLEEFAQAVDPDWQKRQDSEQRKHGNNSRRNKNDDEKEEASSQKAAAITSRSLEKMALEGTEKNPLLAILNRLPGKDGKRWIVFPFDFSDNGREFKVSLRILLETVNRSVCMALDVAINNTAENGETGKRRLFVLEPANRLSVYLQPEISPKEQTSLVRELSALLKISPERIFIKTHTGSFPFEADCGDDFLRSIDEAV